jgi:hypothetical protein
MRLLRRTLLAVLPPVAVPRPGRRCSLTPAADAAQACTGSCQPASLAACPVVPLAFVRTAGVPGPASPPPSPTPGAPGWSTGTVLDSHAATPHPAVGVFFFFFFFFV